MKKLIFLFFLIINHFLISQEIHLYNKAISCYNNGDFNCSKKEFSKLISSSNYSIKVNANFYLALSSANLYELERAEVTNLATLSGLGLATELGLRPLL